MFDDSIQNILNILLGLVTALVILGLCVSGLKTLRTYGTTLSAERVEQKAVINEYRYSGIDGELFSRDEVVALVLDNLNNKDMEVVVKLSESETRPTIESAKRVFTRDLYISHPEDYTADSLKIAGRLEKDTKYKAYLVFRGLDPTLIGTGDSAVVGNVKSRGAYVTGITFIKQP